jgi:transglutaminase-like putative cysteine protease
VDVDPTNDQLVGDRYITTAWGRDYTDVPPVKGVIFTRGDRQDLRVAVDVIRLSDPAAPRDPAPPRAPALPADPAPPSDPARPSDDESEPA